MSNVKPISLDGFRKKKRRRKQNDTSREKWSGFIARNANPSNTQRSSHQPDACTIVEPWWKREIELDLRAEITITEYNLRVIERLLSQNSRFKLVKIFSKSLDKALVALKASEETYRERITLAAGMNLPPYPGEIEELADKLSIRHTNRLGLLISEFRFEPEKRFDL